ncbi:MAG: ATP-dependent DNA helicase RecG [Deltaproteobacteria bacterium]|nr:ATP-dependent DNA helicase RecG [Deltaproteobacteria bacterium]
MNLNQKNQYTKVLSPVSAVKGVGKVIAGELGKRGIHTVFDLLYTLPRSYQDRRQSIPIGKIVPGQSVLVRGTITDIGKVKLKYRAAFEILVNDTTGTISAKWIGSPRHLFRFRKAQKIMLFGRFRRSLRMLETFHPEIIEDGDPIELGRLVPLYSEMEGISQKRMRRIVRDAMREFAPGLEDPLPNRITMDRKLPELEEAIREVHFPTNATLQDLRARRSPAQRRLIFDEFFTLQLTLALKRSKASGQRGIEFAIPDLEVLYGALPFTLTGAQGRVIREITADMSKSVPMNRLLQGDVGCGKTVVAFIAAWIAVSNGYQVAFMAPTQLLAEQHYLSTLELARRMSLRTALLTSGMGSSAEEVRDRVRKHEIDILIGTHALIQESVEFQRLGLAIIDEQHRFGVAQRATLKDKGVGPDVLTMTATPIPRTLGLTLYGDLDISVIDELPPGRMTIQTGLFHERDRGKVYALMRRELDRGRQCYMVYPLIEESEKVELMDATRMAEEIGRVFPDFRVGLIHGRMPVDQREEVMASFKEGAMDILVSTTVIEVGINIPNATVMVIENAERFGLSQIHQLRGRVGRSSYTSKCLLLSSTRLTDEARRRLGILTKSTDGFRIAEEDLAIRGPGEFMGERQSGFYQFRAANLMRDAKILSEARQEAFTLVESDPELAHRTYALLRQLFMNGQKGLGEFADVA